MLSVLDNRKWIKKIRERLDKTGDQEPGQAILRLAIGILVVIYIFLPFGTHDSYSETLFTLGGVNFSLAISLSFLYTSCSLAIFSAILINPVESPIRRVTGITLDALTLSFLMFHSGEGSVPLFFIYLWIILGNGFRYGIKYLYICQAVSIIGFLGVILGGEYWIENRSFASSLLIMLCLLPLYAAFLLRKLHEAIDMAKQANKAKSRFLANMSHELRTPLNGVIGTGQLLRETNLTIEQRELVSSMHSSANTLLELIENILDISKIEAGKVLFENKKFDLHNLVNSVLVMFAPLGEKKGLQVSCYFDPETPFELMGDERYIHQILINLINNAIKFTHTGSVILSVRLVGGTARKPVIRFEIRDTGIGIAADALDKIFENFTQADAGTSRAFGGTGLGTTISKELVNLMGGTIGVESEIDKGSTFWFELPFETEENTAQPSFAKNRILLLASEETASVVRPALKSWDVSFDWVTAPTRAIASLVQAKDENRIYETVLVDQSCLVDLNAIQFSKMVKSENNLDSTALVLINSSDTMMDANRTNQFYISTIENPEDKRLLFNAIHAALSVNMVDQNVVSMADHYESYSGAKALNILVAEDNLVNQQVIQGILKNAGHEIRVANTGDHAMNIISNELDKIDLIILDMNMPEVSGIEVVKALRFLDSKSTVPVIMLTADATPEAKEASLHAGADRFLTKPVDARRLLEVIAKLTRATADTASLGVKTPLLKHKSDNIFKESEWYKNTVLEELNILGGDPEFVLSLVNNFATDGAKHIEKIKNSIDDDYLVYRESLHALKGSSTELGATRLVDICIEGESLKPYDLGGDKIHLICEELEYSFNNTVSALIRAATDCKKQLTGKAGDV